MSVWLVVCVPKSNLIGLSTAAMEDLDKLKVSDLKAKLKERGLDTNGKKADLIARLKYDEVCPISSISLF